MPVIAADRVHHHIGRHKAHAHALFAQPLLRAACLVDLNRELFSLGIDGRKVIAPRCHKAPCFAHGIRHAAAGFGVALLGQGLLFTLPRAVEAQEGLGHPGEACGHIGHFQRRQIDIGKDRIAQRIA